MVMQVDALDILTTKGRFAPEVARAIGEAMDLQIERAHERLATSRQLSEVDADWKRAVASLEVKLEQVKSDIVRWMFAALAGQAAVVFGLVRLFMPHGP
jgi:hypothetical protein